MCVCIMGNCHKEIKSIHPRTTDSIYHTNVPRYLTKAI